MPRSKRTPVRQRGQIEVNDSTGSAGVPAAIRTDARSGSGSSYAARQYSGLVGFSSVLSELATQANKAEQRAYEEAKYQERRAQGKADAAEERARARAEHMADSMEVMAVSKGTASLWLRAAELYNTNQLNDSSQLSAIVDEFMEAGTNASSPAAMNLVANQSNKFLETYTPLIAASTEQQRRELLDKGLAEMTAPVMSAGHLYDDDQFLDAMNAARPAFVEMTGTEIGFDQFMRDQMRGYADAHVGTEEGDEMYNKLERYQESGRLMETSPQKNQEYWSWQQSYGDKVLAREKDERARIKQNEADELEKNVNAAFNYMADKSLDEQKQFVEQLANDPERAQILYGDHYGQVLDKLQGKVTQRSTLEQQETAMREERAVAKHRQEMRTNSAWRPQNALDDKDIGAKGYNILSNDYAKLTDGEEEAHQTFINEVMSIVITEGGRRLGWNNEYVTREQDGNGNQVLKFDPTLSALFESKARQGSIETYEYIDPRDEAAITANKRNRAIRQQQIAEEIISGAALKDFVPPPEPEKLKTNYDIVKERYYTHPDPNAPVSDRLPYINSKAWMDTPEEERRLYGNEFQRIEAERKAIQARYEQERAALRLQYSDESPIAWTMISDAGYSEEEVTKTMDALYGVELEKLEKKYDK